MLRQILKDMYIEPEVLGALNEEQKRTLFLKMRQEQVRRWKEHEEKMEREEPHQPKAKTAHSKNVSWLLGRDGDIQVLVIGESDEFKASKIICSGFGERKSAGLLNHSCNQVSGLKSNLVSSASTEQSGRENLPPKTLSGVQLNLKENGEEMRTQPPPQVREAEGAAGLGDDAEHSAPSSIVSYRPHLRAMPKISSVLQSLAPRDRQEKANPLSVTSRLHPNQPPDPNTGKGRDFRVTAASKRSLSVEAESESTVGGDSCSGRGRVAELMKTFSVTCDSTPSQTPPRASKPPVPTKPSHLQLRPSPLLR
uniref:SH2 domain containing 4A n=1 Tax=Electrophorus electricus TaxID=8005 RepID=A0AAY5F323_ELEEL